MQGRNYNTSNRGNVTDQPLIPSGPVLFWSSEEAGRFPVPPDPPSSGHLTEPHVIARQREASRGALCFFGSLFVGSAPPAGAKKTCSPNKFHTRSRHLQTNWHTHPFKCQR